MPLLICRHGETESNEEERFQGITDSRLTKKGIQQAKALGTYLLNEYKPDLFFVSPAKRAQKTYVLCKNDFQAECTTMPALQEVCYGSWEGIQKKNLLNTPEWKLRELDRFHFRYPDEYEGHRGESYADLYFKLVPFWGKVKNFHKNVVIIAHLGVLLCAKKYFTDINIQELNAYRPTADTVQYIDLNNTFSEITL
ncbi:histidine phosphatase family protein [soil metagenome]